MIGILYPRSILNRLIKGKLSFEKPSFYLEAGREVGEELIFFSPNDIEWKKGKVKGWNGNQQVIKTIPSIVINRTRSNDGHLKRVIQQLKMRGVTISNEHNVVSKLKIHHILMKNRRLHPHLPQTDSVSFHSIKNLLEDNDCLFLKPSRASIGNGIIRIRKVDNDIFAEVNVLGRTDRKKVGIKQIMEVVKKKNRNYLVQQGVSLMKYEGKPVDFRVSVQKDGSGKWKFTGMVGKIAKKGAIVTNLHCGGESIKASTLFGTWGWDPIKIEKKIIKLALRIAKTMDQNLAHLADLGLDIAVDERQHPWFIEANFRDLRITFRDANEREKWKTTFKNPVYYASYLLEKNKPQVSIEPNIYVAPVDELVIFQPGKQEAPEQQELLISSETSLDLNEDQDPQYLTNEIVSKDEVTLCDVVESVLPEYEPEEERQNVPTEEKIIPDPPQK
jgi:glutathione synthase/RimK-type ligase-like ATP-grasp enzyme